MFFPAVESPLNTNRSAHGVLLSRCAARSVLNQCAVCWSCSVICMWRWVSGRGRGVKPAAVHSRSSGDAFHNKKKKACRTGVGDKSSRRIPFPLLRRGEKKRRKGNRSTSAVCPVHMCVLYAQPMGSSAFYRAPPPLGGFSKHQGKKEREKKRQTLALMAFK